VLKENGFYTLLKKTNPELCDSIEEMRQVVRQKEARSRQR